MKSESTRGIPSQVIIGLFVIGIGILFLLDNMDTETLRRAVTIRDAHTHHALLEASGGITLERIPEIAAVGVDLISVGALTHSAPALDISLDLDIA